MPLVYREDCAHGVWGIWKMDEETDANFEPTLGAPLVAAIRQQFPNSPHRRMERLCTRALLQQLTGLTGVDYHPSGSPFLTGDSRHISISHTKGYAAVIVSTERTGIDIERYSDRVTRVAPRFMRSDEQALPYLGTDVWSLLLHWSAKETLYKFLDTEGTDLKEHLRISPFAPQPQGIMQAQEYRTPQCQTLHVGYRIYPDFVLTMIV